MKLYKRIGENGFEHIVQAESDEVAAHMGLLPYQAETKAVSYTHLTLPTKA